MTANLDGESNLKAKQTPIDCLFDRVNMSRRLRNMTCNIACDLPNRKLHSFKGTLLVNSRRYVLPLACCGVFVLCGAALPALHF